MLTVRKIDNTSKRTIPTWCQTDKRLTMESDKNYKTENVCYGVICSKNERARIDIYIEMSLSYITFTIQHIKRV